MKITTFDIETSIRGLPRQLFYQIEDNKRLWSQGAKETFATNLNKRSIQVLF